MKNLDFKPYYRRNLPHYQPPGATLFVTTRLVGSIPQEKLYELQIEAEQVEHRLGQIANPQERAQRAYLEQRRLFGMWDTVLASTENSPQWLANEQVAALVVESIHHRDGQV